MKHILIDLIPAALMSGYLLVIGVRGILTKKPFLFPAYTFSLLLALNILPDHIITRIERIIDTPGEPSSIFLANLFPILLLITIAFIIWRQISGYLVYGATNESFQAALHRALETLKLPYTDLVSRIELPSIGADLKADVQSWIGIGQLSVKPRKHKQMLRAIARDMNEYFRTSPEKATLKASIFNIAFGILLITLMVYL